MNLQKIYSELKRRNVFRVATVYAIVGWLIIQISATVFPILHLPEWTVTFIVALVFIGFPLTIIFAWAFEITPDGLKKTQHVDKEESISSHTGKKINKITVTALSCLILFLLVERVFFAKSTVGNSPSDINTASIAVLPFVNMSGDKDNEYFSDGLSEELLNDLAKVKDIKVAGRTSSFKFKNKNEDLKIVGEQLGVAHILEGSVRKSGGRVRITAQLIKVDDGFHMWSETFDRELTASNIFEIQEEISRKVLGELKVQLLPVENTLLNDIPTQDIEAYQAFLKANQLVVNRNYDEIEAAIDLYKSAIQIDPGFAEAHGRLALAYNAQGYYGNIPFAEMQKNIKNTADQSMALNNETAEAFSALGNYYENTSDLDKALEMLLKSNELNPNLIDNYNWIGNIYESLGKRDKQMEWYRQGYEKDPLNPLTIYNRIRVSLENEDYEEMEVFMDKNIRINPDFIPTYFLKGTVQFGAPFGRFDEAGTYFMQVYNSDNDFPRAMSFLIYISIVLDIPEMSDYYYELLKQNYTESFEFRIAIGFYERTKGIYSDFETTTLTFYDERNVIPQDQFAYFDLYDYAMKTENFVRVLPYFKKFDPNLFSDTLSVLTARNKDQASSLALLLKEIESTEQAARITQAFCAYTERSKETYKNGEDDFRYQSDLTTCSFLKEDMEAFYTNLSTLYKKNRDLISTYVSLKNIEEFYPELYSAQLKALHRELRKELAGQRANFISYLKTKGEWKEEWDQSIKN